MSRWSQRVSPTKFSKKAAAVAAGRVLDVDDQAVDIAVVIFPEPQRPDTLAGLSHALIHRG
jgi:hypothetical protein